jgi:hypothetical protein
MKSFALAAVTLFSTAASAQSALVISCGDCGSFEVLEVAVDGQPVSPGNAQATYRVELTPGDHEIQTWKWVNPFKREDLATQVLRFPKNTELRVKASFNKLNVYGKGKLEPVASGPSQDAVNNASDLIAEASDYVREAAEYNDEEDSRCQSKVAAKLEVIGDNLKELRGSLDVGLLRKTASKASDTQSLVESDCPGRVRKTLGKKLGKVVARLDKASAALR